VQAFLIGVENSGADGIAADAEVWVNELRLSKLDERGGYAAIGRVDMQLADLGTVAFSASTHTTGFGTLEQRVNERARENFMQYDVAATLSLVNYYHPVSACLYRSMRASTQLFVLLSMTHMILTLGFLKNLIVLAAKQEAT
jgi:hypothetical protein